MVVEVVWFLKKKHSEKTFKETLNIHVSISNDTKDINKASEIMFSRIITDDTGKSKQHAIYNALEFLMTKYHACF